jgi:hypothetical protein
MNRLVLVIIVLLSMTSSACSKERMGESAPTGSSVIVCTTQGEDCPNGGIRVYFGTVIVQITRVGETFIVRDIYGDVRDTKRIISTLVNNRDWIPLDGTAHISPKQMFERLTFSIKIDELGSSTTCNVESAASNKSAGFFVYCEN